MQLSQSLLYVCLLVSSATALPNQLAARGPGPACVIPPYLYGCGTSLLPRCCTLEEYEKEHPSTTTTTTTYPTPTALTPRGPGPACVVPPYLYGCGTSLAPQCCTYEEYVEKYGVPPPTATASS